MVGASVEVAWLVPTPSAVRFSREKLPEAVAGQPTDELDIGAEPRRGPCRVVRRAAESGLDRAVTGDDEVNQCFSDDDDHDVIRSMPRTGDRHGRRPGHDRPATGDGVSPSGNAVWIAVPGTSSTITRSDAHRTERSLHKESMDSSEPSTGQPKKIGGFATRLGLLVGTNMAVIALFTVVASIFGVDPQGLVGLTIFAALFGFGGSFISLALSKRIAKRSTGAVVIENPSNASERWLRRHGGAAVA